MRTEPARLCTTDADYKRFGIAKGNPQPFEDDMRSPGGKGSFEWWYTDANYDDGTTVVAIWFTKNYFDVEGPAWPTVDIEITEKDGTRINHRMQGPKGVPLKKSGTACDVNIEGNTIRYVDGTYRLHYDDGSIQYDVTMTPTMPMWRPDCGIWLFGEGSREIEYGWFVPCPTARIEGRLVVNGVERKLTGKGYHDHNWGYTGIQNMLNHWYWGRAQVGDYTVIAVQNVAEKKYGYKSLPVFMIAKDGKILNDDSSSVKIERFETHINSFTKKFMDDVLVYTQTVSPDEEYVVKFVRKRDIMPRSLLEVVSPAKRFLAKLARMNPTYMRVMGDVTVTVKRNGKTDTVTREGLWEQYFMGSNKLATIEGVTYPLSN